MKLILVMSLSGSFIFLSDFILNAWIKKRFSIRWRYQLLKLAMLFFIVPFPLFQGFWVNVLPFGRYYDGIGERITFDYTKSIILTESGGMVLPSYNFKRIFFCIWLAGFFVVMLTQLISYCRYKRKLQKTANIIENGVIIQLFNSVKDTCNIRRRLRLMKSDIVNSPLTFGVFSPIIVLPDKEYKMEELQIILLHEMIHIRKYDLLFRFLSLLAISIHWYNPLTYWLFRRICFISESDCDEQIVMNQDREYRILYGNMIIDAATDMSGKQMLTASFGLAGNHKKLLKERLEILMGMNKVKKNVGILSIVTMAAIFMGGTITTFAYSEPTVIKNSENSSFNESAFTFGGSISFNNSENCFIDENGNKHLLKDNDRARAVCIHDYRDGSYETHKRNSDGSCVTKYYDAKCCVKCSQVVVGNYIGSTTLVRCNH